MGLWKILAEKARQCNLHIGGTLIEKSDGDFYNTSILFGPDGHMVGSYRKIHLFRSIEEDRYFSPGTHLELMELPWGKTGLATCYDLRFPEIFRQYALAGARMILLPAEWPERRLDHWRTLIRARAIENQLFIVAVNATGYFLTEPYAGHSAVINPWGEAVIEAGVEECLLTVEIDLGQIEKVRERIPVFKDRHPEAYHLNNNNSV
jgi:predicted amidohydrolase